MMSQVLDVPARPSRSRATGVGDAALAHEDHEPPVARFTRTRHALRAALQRRVAAGDAARDERPAEMMAVAFEQQTALPRRARGVQARDHRAVGAQHFEPLADLEPAIGEDDVALHRPQRVIRLARQRRRARRARRRCSG